jgi:hypothetical protein
MGRGRARTALAAGVIGLLLLVAAGCGASSHPNEPRPQPSTRVSVTISPKAVTVQPTRIAFGPEPRQQIPQNQRQGQPRIDTDKPLQVTFVAANQTTSDSHLVVRGPRDATSGPLLATSPGSFQTELPAGVYTITATDIPGAKPGKLVVGPVRASSQNDVLLP